MEIKSPPGANGCDNKENSFLLRILERVEVLIIQYHLAIREFQIGLSGIMLDLRPEMASFCSQRNSVGLEWVWFLSLLSFNSQFE